MKGKFITFEGTEGSGKSTQSKLLCAYLRRKGRRIIWLREPGGTQTAEQIRRTLLEPRNHIAPLSETLLYMAARADVVNKIIRPALLKGKIVVCDRFLDSTLAYQGYGLGININFIKSVGNLVTQGIKPDLTIFLDLPIKKGLKHRQAGKDRIEKRPLAYHRRVRRGYLELAAQEPRRIKIVKVAKDISITQEKIILLVDKNVI